MGEGVPSNLKFLPGVGLGRGVKFLMYLLERGGGPGNLETPLATPLQLVGLAVPSCVKWHELNSLRSLGYR